MKTKCLSFWLIVIFSISINSQSIINTLGSGGTFEIKDGTPTTFLSLSQATGDLTLNNSFFLPQIANSTIGTIYKGSQSFIHTFQVSGTSGNNLFVGIGAGNFTMNGTGTESSWNTGVGNYALTSLTTGKTNVAFGLYSLLNNTTGYSNSAVGVYSLKANTTGHDNSAVGVYSLQSNTAGNYNSAFGQQSLYYNTGDHNSAFGMNAGANVTSGSNLTLIGYSAQPSSATATNEITLGNNIGSTILRCNTPTITSLSDARDKKNIQDLQLGLDFLMKVKPRQFNWDRREWYENKIADGSKMLKTPTAGFIAQELDTVQMSANAEWLKLVLKDNPDKLEATAGNLLPIIVKAIQELKEENVKFKKEKNQQITKLENENSKLAEENLKLQKDISVISSSITEQVRKEVKAMLLKVAEVGDATEIVSISKK